MDKPEQSDSVGSPQLSEGTYSDAGSNRRTPAVDSHYSEDEEANNFAPVSETGSRGRSAADPLSYTANHETLNTHQLDSDSDSNVKTPCDQDTNQVKDDESSNSDANSEKAKSVQGSSAIIGSQGDDIFAAHSTSEDEETAADAQGKVLRGSPPASPTSDHARRIPSPTQQDLFGDADDVTTSSEGEDEVKKQSSDQIHHVTDTTTASPGGLTGDEQAANEIEIDEELAETLIDVEIPKISADLGNQLHFVKFPNFLSVEPRPFDPDTYEDEIDDDDVLDEEGRSRVKLKVENTIRWRQTSDPDGSNVKRASNAKIVRWSDGSLSLYLGGEVFDVHTHPLQGDHHHLFIRQGTGLQGRAIFRTKLTFRPHSTESFTHRKMTLSMADRTSKTQKVKVLPAVGKDPEALKQEMMKREDERLRASARRESQQRRSRERMAHGRGGLSAGYLEPDRGESDDDNGVSISAIKRSFKVGGKDFAAARAIYASDDDDEDDANYSGNEEGGVASSVADHLKGGKQLERAKRLDSDEDNVDLASPDEPKKRRANVIEDDDDDDL